MDQPIEVPRAIEDTAKELGWSVTRVAAEAEVTERTARTWMSGKRKITAEKLVLLASRMPGLERRLFARRRGSA